MAAEDPADKLVRALEQLSEDDRREVTAWLFNRTATPLANSQSSALRALRDVGTHRSRAAIADLVARESSTEETQLVTIRLPVAQHAQLRDWCEQNNFPMAAVVRGLIGRFLDNSSPR